MIRLLLCMFRKETLAEYLLRHCTIPPDIKEELEEIETIQRRRKFPPGGPPARKGKGGGWLAEWENRQDRANPY